MKVIAITHFSTPNVLWHYNVKQMINEHLKRNPYTKDVDTVKTNVKTFEQDEITHHKNNLNSRRILIEYRMCGKTKHCNKL